MTPPVKIRLIRDNLLVGTHVYRTGDVIEVQGEKAKEMVKGGHAAVAEPDAPITPAGKQRLRSEVVAENAAKKSPPVAERAVRQPRAAAAV